MSDDQHPDALELPSLEAIGEQIVRAARADETNGWFGVVRRGQRRRIRLPLALTAALAVVAAAAAALVVVVVPGRGGLDAIARADDALAPNGQIIHMRLTSTLVGGHVARRVPRRQTTELWSAGDPVRWRVVQDIPARGREEFAFADDAQRSYSARQDRLRVISGYTGKDLVAASRTPSLVPVDPERDLRPMIARGELKDVGEVKAGSRTVHRFTGEQRYPHNAGVQRVSYDVDPKTYAPIGGELDMTFFSHDRRGAKQATTLRQVFRVDRYDKLPDDDAHDHLLRIATTPHTKVTTETIAQIRARVRRRLIRNRHRFVGAPRVAIVPNAGGQRLMVAVRVDTLGGAPSTAVRLTVGTRHGTAYGSPSRPAKPIGAPGRHCFLTSLAPGDLPAALRGVRAGTIVRVLLRVHGTFEILVNAQVQRYRSDARALDPAHYARTLDCG